MSSEHGKDKETVAIWMGSRGILLDPEGYMLFAKRGDEQERNLLVSPHLIWDNLVGTKPDEVQFVEKQIKEDLTEGRSVVVVGAGLPLHGKKCIGELVLKIDHDRRLHNTVHKKTGKNLITRHGTFDEGIRLVEILYSKLERAGVSLPTDRRELVHQKFADNSRVIAGTVIREIDGAKERNEVVLVGTETVLMTHGAYDMGGGAVEQLLQYYQDDPSVKIRGVGILGDRRETVAALHERQAVGGEDRKAILYLEEQSIMPRSYAKKGGLIEFRHNMADAVTAQKIEAIVVGLINEASKNGKLPFALPPGWLHGAYWRDIYRQFFRQQFIAVGFPEDGLGRDFWIFDNNFLPVDLDIRYRRTPRKFKMPFKEVAREISLERYVLSEP